MAAKEFGLAGIIVLTLLTIGCIGSNAATIDCGSDKVCFVNAMKNCSDSKVTLSNDNTSFDIALSKARDTLCRYQVTLTASSKRPESVGKSAVCEAYNSMDAAKAANPGQGYYVSFPAENIYNDPSQLNTTVINVMLLFANCSGELFNDINATINYPTKVEACVDGTAYNQCSSTKPKYCDNGKLIDNCIKCGCLVGWVCNSSSACYAQRCSDDTVYGHCGAPMPRYCSNGIIVYNCSYCGCLPGDSCDPRYQICYPASAR